MTIYSELSTAKSDLTRNRWVSPHSGIGKHIGPAGQVSYWRDSIDPGERAEFDEWVRQNVKGDTGLDSMGAAQTLEDPKFDSVRFPKHYNRGEGGDVMDFINAQGLNFQRGSAVKYVVRAGDKNPETEIEDLEKARYFLEREIAFIKARKGIQ